MGVNAGRVDVTVPQDAGQVLDVLLLLVKAPRKQMPQVVREHLLRCDLRRPAQRLHHTPNVGAVQRPPAAGHKDRPLADAPRPAIGKQPRAERPRQKQQAAFALVADLRPPLARRAHGKEPQLTDPQPQAAQGLEHQRQALVPLGPGGRHQARILRPAHLTAGVPVQRALDAQRLDAALAPAAVGKVPVERRQHTVHAGRGIALRQHRLILDHGFFCHRAPAQLNAEPPQLARIFFDGVPAALRLPQRADIRPDPRSLYIMFLHGRPSVFYSILPWGNGVG